ncbi:hypothetical protein ACFSFY_00565 [Sporosarcina siberiensis]|uniref:YqgU-like 6-bladed beta-propeller domain-containing protein n=1 Tax=Sporosarcina siberiensis TaxID=1365606 RepID=A0ABW4SB24_9BACL
MLFALFVTALIVTGCSKKNGNTEKIPEKTAPIEEEESITVEESVVHTLTSDQGKFHFIADWLTDTSILFVEKDQNKYFLKIFDFETGDIAILFEDTSVIADVKIHPSKELILLHTSNNPTSATIKILGLDGILKDEITVESSELSIEWNDLDPSLILLTAFHQDWTYDVFLYDGKSLDNGFGLIDIGNPFPKWAGKGSILTNSLDEHPLDGGSLNIYDLATDKWIASELTDIVYVDTYEESILVVRIEDNETAHYSITNLDGTVTADWQMPAVSNYSEWIIPEINWVTGNTVILATHDLGGQLDVLDEPYRLTRVSDGQQKLLEGNVTPSLLRCSASGERCLTGYSAEILINTVTGEEKVWLKLTE